MTSVPERPSDEVLAALDEAYDFLRAIGRRVLAARDTGEPPAPAPKPKRTRRPSPSKLAKWEAAWQAEQGAEAES